VKSRHRYRSASLGIAWRHLYNVATNPEYLLPPVIFPIIFLVAFAGGLSAMRNVPGFHYPLGYTAFQYVFVLLQTAAFGGVFTGFSIALDYESGFARRLMLATPHRSAIVAGYAIAALVRAVVIGALVTVASLIAGMKVGGDGVDFAGLVVLNLVVTVTASLFAAGVALRMRTIQAGILMQTTIFLLLFLAPIYVPLGLLTGWMHAVASVNPASAMLAAGRSLLAGTTGSVALAFAAAAALAALLAFYAIRGLRKAEAAG
jgi:ABC-2 type transport system permease protein